ncbi:MAG: hypothetical protein IKA21_02010 [Phascolarctobacterium sp.]|nr:hypothetical protein [Phascolarctobacterium sp.]
MAGSFIIGAWTVFVERLSKRLPNFTGKAAVVAGGLLGVQALEIVLPGYNVEASRAVVVFLIIYGALAIFSRKTFE